MMKFYTQKCLLVMAFILGGFSVANAQHYEQFGTPITVGSGQYGYYNNYGDSVSFMFVNLPQGAFGSPVLSVFFYGDDGDMGENVDVYIDQNYLGNRAENLNGDCSVEDSVAMAVSYTALNTYTSNDTIIVTCFPSNQVDFFCTGPTTVRVKLIYDYCPFGNPVQFASFTVADSTLCSYQSAVALTGLPTGGTYVGTGVSGNTFNPAGLNPGSYTVTYTATDAIGCTTSATRTVKVLSEPSIADSYICQGGNGTFTPTTGYQYIWYSQPNYNGVIDTTTGPLTYGPFNQPTTLYVADVSSPIIYRVDSLLTNNAVVIDINSNAGDDRGTIAVTDNYVYMVGDNNTVRYDLDLTSSVSLPIMDGLFADIATHNLYTLCSDAAGTFLIYGDGNIGSIYNLNDDLTTNGNPVVLSMNIPLNGGGDMFFSGAGMAGVYSTNTNSFYLIDPASGQVTNLGAVAAPPYYYGSENWAAYGVLEYDGSNYSIVYRDGNYSPASIVRQTMPGGAPMPHTTFVSDLSDLAAFTFSTVNQRWYFHYEGSCGTFGGSTESLGYADGQDTMVTLPGTVGCYASFDLDMDIIDLGNDTTVCEGQTPVILEAGNGYVSYTWNGVNNNWNIYPVTASGQYIVDAVNSIGCHVIDTTTVTVNACLSINEELGMQASVYPNPSNGNFNVQLTLVEEGSAEIEVMDMHGRKIYSRVVEVAANANIPVSLAGVQDGIYIVTVRFNDHTSNFKMIIKQ